MLSSITKVRLRNIKRERFAIKEKEVKGNFVLTEEAENRLQKIKNFFDEKLPTILEGPTGTSKTKTKQVLCEILDKK